MTDRPLDCFERAVLDYVKYLRTLQVKAYQARALGTLEFAGACLAIVLECARRINYEEPDSPPDSKLVCFSVAVGYVAEALIQREYAKGDLLKRDTGDGTLNTGDFMDYKGPIPHEP